MLIVVEQDEDVEVYAPPTAPGKLELYQVKSTRVDRYSPTELTKLRGGKSWLAALFESSSKPRVGWEVTAALVSSARLDVKLAGGGSALNLLSVPLNEIADPALSSLRNALSTQLRQPNAADFVMTCTYRRTKLTPDAHIETTLGEIADYFHERFGVRAPSAKAFYVALVAEIRRKAGDEYDSRTHDEMTKRKAFSSQNVEQKILRVHREAQPDFESQYWALLEPDIQRALDLLDRRNLRSAWRRFAIDQIEPRSTECVRLAAEAHAQLQQASPGSLQELLEIAAAINLANPELELNYVRAVVLWTFAADGTGTVPSATQGTTN